MESVEDRFAIEGLSNKLGSAVVKESLDDFKTEYTRDAYATIRSSYLLHPSCCSAPLW